MFDHKKNRNSFIVSDLVNELFGPSHYHKENFGTRLSHHESEAINIKQKISFQGWEQVKQSIFRQEDTQEEIISGKDSPSARYSVGILFPNEKHEQEGHILEDQGVDDEEEKEINEEVQDKNNTEKNKEEIADNEIPEEDAALDYELTTSNQRLQSSAAISFCVEEKNLKKLKVRATGGIYNPFNVEVVWKKKGEPAVSNPTWWARESFEAEFEKMYTPIEEPFSLDLLSSTHKDFNINVKIFKKEVIGFEGKSKDCILTIVLMNNNPSSASNSKNTQSLFQTYFEIFALDKDDNSIIKPYPDSYKEDLDDKDGSMLKQMYSSKKVFAIGHGTSADWEKDEHESCPKKIFASFLPIHEIPATSPDVKINEKDLSPEMKLLASNNTDEWQKGLNQVKQIIDEYKNWIISLKRDSQSVTTSRMISECEESLSRMEDGYKLLTEDSEVIKVFKWTNEAMFKQQIRSKDLRKVVFKDKAKARPEWGDFPSTSDKKGLWRAFQIAFLVMNLRSIVEPHNSELRDNVELIWFPTGGGKTEAYFGLAAFSILWRRRLDPLDNGTEVIMRYTLRLLTTQQYQRAASLICALDIIRSKNEELLGKDRITLGLWIGGGSSPNTTEQLAKAWRDIKDERYPKNNFVINQCPWCGAEMGIPRKQRALLKTQPPLGYSREGQGKTLKVTFYCPDERCDFNCHNGLPLFVDDVSIYEETPSMLIGTIDKLAMLAFKSGAKNFPVFGRNNDGEQIKSPPGLIIQDELHLISGPLGSVSGIWEALIENFCTNNLKGDPIKPKIICSTATIRKYEEQILSLYGRTKTTLFPPPGLDATDSFFGKQIKAKGTGKLYVGVLAPSIGSALTAQTRVFTSLLQSSASLPSIKEKDPWHTLMLFFNSIRELGGAETLFQTDISDYSGAYLDRHPGLNKRYPNNRIRLTGELTSDELPIKLEEISKSTEDDWPVDVCLATNILEVGVDISRLSLMAVVGQPKTTSTYIQATGRVGRDINRPGLIVTIYSPAKPRDRSHYEKFRTYHETLYSQVEPTSVTPFSTAALEKALHATFVAYVRLHGGQEVKEHPDPFPEKLANDFIDMMEGRAKFIFNNQEYKDPDLVKNFNSLMNKRVNQWKKWQKQDWEFNTKKENFPLLVRAGTDETASKDKNVWLTMMNMRSVDANCKLKITDKYLNDDEDLL